MNNNNGAYNVSAIKYYGKETARKIVAYMASWSGYLSYSEKQRDRRYGGYIRMVSYHDTPPADEKQFEKHLRYFSKRYHPATWKDVVALSRGEDWIHDKPGIIISFDDGVVTNYTVAAPLLDKYGLTGIFLIVTDWVDCPIDDQLQYAEDHQISLPGSSWELKQKAMSWEQISNLADRGHKIASHTRTHRRFTEKDLPEVVHAEVQRSKAILEDRLRQPVEIFSWVGGEFSVYQPKVLRAVQESGYNFVLSTFGMPITLGVDKWFIGRTALKSCSSLPVVRLFLLLRYDRVCRFVENKIRVRFGMPEKFDL